MRIEARHSRFAVTNLGPYVLKQALRHARKVLEDDLKAGDRAGNTGELPELKAGDPAGNTTLEQGTTAARGRS
jgi:hypothetical protein